MKIKQLYYISAVIFTLLLTACDPWKDDTALIDGNSDKPLDEIVQTNNEISVFAEILQLTGYDKFIREQQSLTIFAPTNEALKSLDKSNTEKLTEWIENHIACLTYYTDKSGNFEATTVEMVNGKKVPVSTGSISGSNIIKNNLLGLNGVLHIIDSQITERKSIWDYMQEQNGYQQIDFIDSYYEKVMDMDKSTPNGINELGQQVYDTVWVTRNTFLDYYPIDNENYDFTVVLLDNEVLNQLKTKYDKYMIQKDPVAQEKEVMRHLTSDLILHKQTLTSQGRYQSVNNLLVDIDPANIKESYQASNGWVYKLSAADIKIYNNKIKEQIIEAEDYFSRYDGESTDPLSDRWILRYRSYASGGQDMVLKGRTLNYVDWQYYDAELDSTLTGTATYDFRYPYRLLDQHLCRRSNAYIEYKPTVYSVDYNIYWMAYPENSDFTINTSGTPPAESGMGVPPMILEQKLFISFPGEENLKRDSEGVITGNFSPYSVMAGVTQAGVLEETKLTRYRANVANDGFFLLDQPYAGEDSFGAGELLKSPGYGTATFYIANTPREKNATSGMVFLDYIRLVPLVDPND